MKFSLETQDHKLSINAYSAEGIQIANQWYRSHILLTPDKLIENWQAPPAAELTLDNFADLLEEKPEVLLLGTGVQLHFPGAALRAAFAKRQIGLEVMDTQAACRTYNILLSEERSVAAALMQEPSATVA